MSKRFDWDIPEIKEFLGSRRSQWHPSEILNNDNIPLERPDRAPSDKYEAWGRRSLTDMTGNIGSAWENYLEETFHMTVVDEGPIDLRVTDGIFEGSPVQAKNSCIITGRGYYDDGRAKSSPGVTYMRAHNMEKLANLDLSGFEGLEEDNFSKPGLVHAAVHYPLEDMPKLPKDIPVRTIEHPNQDYEVETAYIGEIVVPAKPVYIDSKDRFGNGERKAWPLRWDELFGVEDKNSNYMDYWTQI